MISSSCCRSDQPMTSRAKSCLVDLSPRERQKGGGDRTPGAVPMPSAWIMASEGVTRPARPSNRTSSCPGARNKARAGQGSSEPPALTL